MRSSEAITFGECKFLDEENHISICKPSSDSAHTYVILRDFITVSIVKKMRVIIITLMIPHTHTHNNNKKNHCAYMLINTSKENY